MHRIRKRVVFPAPFLPMTVEIFSEPNSKVTESKANFFDALYALLTSIVEMAEVINGQLLLRGVTCIKNMLGDDFGLAFMLEVPGPVPDLKFKEGRWQNLKRSDRTSSLSF